MISVIVFYSPSRKKLFEAAWSVLSPLHTEFEKILCCDGPCNIEPKEFKVLEISRKTKFFNWANVWSAGLEAAKHDIIHYIDCDRFYGPNYLKEAITGIDENTILYPSKTYGFSDFQNIRKIIDDPDFLKLALEPRTQIPLKSQQCPSGKNPISGNTFITKRCYFSVGGFDPSFEGYGYADTDFFLRAYRRGICMKEIPKPEYHLSHETETDSWTHLMMSIYNNRLLCKKHGLLPTDHIAALKINNCIFDQQIDQSPNLESFLKSVPFTRPIYL